MACVTSGWNCSAIGRAAVAERLHRKRIAFGQQSRAERQVEAFAVPLVDLLRPGIADRAPDLGRPDRVVADLGVAVGMLVDPAAEMVRQHLRAEADAEKRLASRCSGTPSQSISRRMKSSVSLALIGPPKMMAPACSVHGLRQRIAEPRTAHVERIAALAQRVADAPRRRSLLVHDDQDRLQHGGSRLNRNRGHQC